MRKFIHSWFDARRLLTTSFVFAVAVLWGGLAWSAETYAIDTAHSSVGFAIKHMMVSTVPGTFDDYKGSITYDPKDLAAFKAEATIQATSVNTRQAKRDDHLRSADFFDVAKFPTIIFVSKKFDQDEMGHGSMTGDLTIKGITKEVSVPVTIDGPVKSPMGGDAIGLTGSFTLNRQDYGITWGKAMDGGGLMLGNDVKVDFSFEAHKQ